MSEVRVLPAVHLKIRRDDGMTAIIDNVMVTGTPDEINYLIKLRGDKPDQTNVCKPKPFNPLSRLTGQPYISTINPVVKL